MIDPKETEKWEALQEALKLHRGDRDHPEVVRARMRWNRSGGFAQFRSDTAAIAFAAFPTFRAPKTKPAIAAPRIIAKVERGERTAALAWKDGELYILDSFWGTPLGDPRNYRKLEMNARNLNEARCEARAQFASSKIIREIEAALASIL